MHLNDIEHSRSKARHPQTHGACERLNQIILEEFYQVAFRKKLYRCLDEIQTDLDEYMQYYNERRTNQGKRCQGKTPRETFEQGLELYWNYVHLQTEAVSTDSDSNPTEILSKGETQKEDSVDNIKVDCINFV